MSESKYKNAVCKGSYIFGTACGHCERCKEEIEKNGKEWNTMNEQLEEIKKLKEENEKLKEQLSIAKGTLEFISHDCLNSETHCPTRDSMRVKSKFSLEKIKALEGILK